MKRKITIFTLAMLILACSITAIAAEEVSIGDFSFEIPDDYKINQSTDEQVALEADDKHAIVILISDKLADSDDTVKSLEGEGYKFLGEETYDAEGYEIHQQNFEKDGLTTYSYNFELGDGTYCIITLTMPSSEAALENEDNPVTEILESFK